MKTKLFWTVCLTMLLSSISFAQYAPKNINQGSNFNRPGVDEEDRNFIMKDAEIGLEEHKKENGGKIDLTKFKPVVMKALYETFQAEEITRAELVEIRNAYEKLEKDAVKNQMSQAQIEEALRGLFKKLFEKIQNTKLQCTQVGKQCNNWGCCPGLVCAAVPQRAWQAFPKQCKRFRVQCKQDSECCSGECVDSLENGKKVCSAVRRCFKPNKGGASCDKNPVCGEGECLPFNRGLLGINECSQRGDSCSSNDDCCSNKCNRGKCVANYLCKNCVGQGVEPKRGQKCCEGLYKDPDTKKCIREMPPFVLPQVKVVPMKKSIFALVASLFLSDAQAFNPAQFQQVIQNAQNSGNITNQVRDAAKNNAEFKNKMNLQNSGYSGPNPYGVEKDAKYKDHELAEFNVREGSNFDTCEIDLKADYLIRLRDYGKDGNGLGGINNAIGMEMALMAFEYMTLGDEGIQDYWRSDRNDPKTTIYERMRKVAKDHRDNRHDIFKDLTDQSRRLQCLCWDKTGYTKLEDDIKETFQEQCPDEYAAYKDYRDSNPNMKDEDYSGDATGVKSQALMVRWLELVVEIEGAMSVQNTQVFEGLNELAIWANQNDWGNHEVKKPKLYDWTMRTGGYVVKGGDYAYEQMNMETAAVIVSGVAAIIAGVAALATMPGLWVSAGILAGSLTVGGTGMWIVGAMKGAWESRAPLIKDYSKRDYKCGKKSWCTDFKREIHVPKSPICNSWVSGNGCLKKFLMVKHDDKDRYVVDPFIPLGVKKSKLIKDGKKFTDYFNEAKSRAVTKFKSRKPSGRQGQGYLKQVFIDAIQVGHMTPRFKAPLKNYYEVKNGMIKEIKKHAKLYILNEGVFASDIGRCDMPGAGSGCSGGTSQFKAKFGGKIWYFDSARNAAKMKRDINKLKEDMDKFADYAYDFHWVWPRLAQEGMIAYPMPGFISYLELVSNTMGNKASVNVGNVNDINDQLLKPQLQNLQMTCSKYVEAEGQTPNGTIAGDCNQMMATRLEGAVVDKVTGNGLFDGMDDLLGNSQAYAGGFDLGAGNGAGSGGNMAFKGNRGGDGVSGNLSGGNVSGSGDDSGLQGAAKAKRKLRDIRKKQLDRLSKFKEAVGAGRFDNLMNAQKAMVSKFNNPNGGSIASLGTGGLAGDGKNAAGKSNRNGLLGGGNLGKGNGAGGVTIPQPKYDLSYSTGGSGSGDGSGMSAEMSAAQDRLAEAVEYRDQNPEDYKKNRDGDTLWKIITRSYIRNYDKLLRKRKKRIDPGL